MFKKILVPYDGSGPANKALGQAVNIAKSLGRRKLYCLVLNKNLPSFFFYFTQCPLQVHLKVLKSATGMTGALQDSAIMEHIYFERNNRQYE